MATGDPAPPMVEDPQKQTFGIPTGGPNIDMAQAALLKDATADEQRTIRPEPLGYIVAEAKINPRVWSYRDNLPVLDAEVAAQIYKAPDDWRFVFFRFRGEIDVSIEEQDFGQVWRSEAPSVRNVWYGRLKLDGSDDARVTFLMPTEPTWADPNDPQPNPPSQPLRDGWMRGRGLFLGIEFVRDRQSLEPAAGVASYAVARMKDRGILLSTDGPENNVIKIKPPMPFSHADGERLVRELDEALGHDVVRALSSS